MVYGGGSIKRNGAYDDVAASLRAAGIPWVELGGVQPNPRSGKVYEGIDLCRREGVDFILAVGGGSAIDTAKAIGVGVPYDGDFWDFYSKKAAEQTVPVGVVLTLSATGSEASDSSVITLEGENLKWGNIKSDIYRPVFAVMNPRYTCSLPAYQTASGATDMLSHIMERYFTPTEHVDVTDRLCEGLMKTILTAAPKALADPGDYNARADLMWAGMLAHNNLCGVGRRQDWASHQIEHELSALYDCAHGAGLAVVTPAWMTYVMDRDIARFAQFAVRVFGCEMDFRQPENTARAGVERLVACAPFDAPAEAIRQLARQGIPGGQGTALAVNAAQRLLCQGIALIHHPSDAEVHDLDGTVFQHHHVMGLDIPVDNAPAVGVLQCLGNLHGKM